MNNEQTVRKAYEVSAKAEPEGLVDSFSPDGTFPDLFTNVTDRGPDVPGSLRAAAATHTTACPDVHRKIVSVEPRPLGMVTLPELAVPGDLEAATGQGG